MGRAIHDPMSNGTSPASSSGRLRDRLARTRASLGQGLARLFGQSVQEEDWEAVEESLLLADVGIDATGAILDALRRQRAAGADAAALRRNARATVADMLRPCELALDVEAVAPPFVIMVVGVNGVGKTTTIGKLAARLAGEGRTVMLAAGDTFRAAAIDQLRAWAERIGVPIIAQSPGADAASVAHDALDAAQARQVDVLIIDTAGRQHTDHNLMEEIRKIRRVVARRLPGAPHEVLQVLDAGTGQNAATQLERFHDAVAVTGLVLTKLDGTARGGTVIALARRFGLPIRFIGTGESAGDLDLFDAESFAEALLPS